MLKQLFCSLFLLIFANSFAQIINEEPYILTIDQLKNWTEDGATADADLISTVNLATRFENTDTQLNSDLSNNMKIAYLPDGMNNLGNYNGEQDKFNLYNFSNWAYIDKLVWFGGTADQTVQLPSKPWANAAHRNGVKILGDIFFAPNAFGGSTATLQDFLEQDTNGDFVVIPKLVAIMNYYNFDGWFINEETSTNPETGQLMHDFVKELTAQVEADGKEVMWYDAMLINGQVNYQNYLSADNTVFFQNDADGNPSNGYEERVSSSIFINFFWQGSSGPSTSNGNAAAVGRSPFEVFTGVDLAPDRNQPAFENGGNSWMSSLYQNRNTPYTSLGLFYPDAVYRNSQYSNFNNNPNDYLSFYNAERQMFSGQDQNPATDDNSGFKGYAYWMPAASVISELPFETNFNTGHGLKKFAEGEQISSQSWSNMDDQDILPTWQFASSENGPLSANWDFEEAYNGGSSLEIHGNLPSNNPIVLKLYKTKLPVTADTKVDVVFDYGSTASPQMSLLLTFEDEPSQAVEIPILAGGPGWSGHSYSLSNYAGKTLASLGLQFASSDALNDYTIKIGNLKVHNGPALSVSTFKADSPKVKVIYPQNSTVELTINWPSASKLNYILYDLSGRKMTTGQIGNEAFNSYKLPMENFSSGIYLLKISNQNGTSITKKIVVH